MNHFKYHKSQSCFNSENITSFQNKRLIALFDITGFEPLGFTKQSLKNKN